jgi:hypothetical protein
MRARFTVLCGILTFVALIGPQIGSGVPEDKKARPYTPKEMVGVWIGFDSDELTFTRLDLRADSTGYCARVSPADTVLHDQGVKIYRITKWSLNGWNIEIHMVPVSNATGVGYVKGRIGLASINLTIGGPESGGWKVVPFLQPESRMLVSNQETQRKIEEVEKN